MSHSSTEQWREHLEAHGWAVVPGVLNPEECALLRDGMWRHASHCVAGLRKEDPSTWKKIYDMFPSHGMLQQGYRFGNIQEVYDVRSNPKVTRAFEVLWGTPHLTSSIDGVSFGLAPEITRRGWEHSGWLHLDQRPDPNSTFECVQGWVTAEDVDGTGDGTLRVLEGSHKLHAEFARHFGLQCKSDWYKLTPEEIAFYENRGCRIVDVSCAAGDQVLWDSRTVHSGRSPVRGRSTSGRNRYVVYTCYWPTSRLTPSRAEKKRAMVLEGRTSSHWPDARRTFGLKPRTYGKPYAPIPEYPAPPALTRYGASLFGWHNFPGSYPNLRDAGEIVNNEDGNESAVENGNASGPVDDATPTQDRSKRARIN